MAVHLPSLFPRVAGTQPKYPARINWRHPLADGLVFFAFGTKNYVDDTVINWYGTGSPDWHVDRNGVNWETNIARNGWRFPAPSVKRLTGSTKHAVAWRSAIDSAAGGWVRTYNIPRLEDGWTSPLSIISTGRRGTDDDYAHAITVGGTETFHQFASTTYIDATKRDFLIQRNGANIEWFTNNSSIQTITNAATGGLDAPDDGGYVSVHCQNRTQVSAADSVDGRTEYIAIWNRNLSEGERFQVYLDPYQIFEPAVTGLHGSFYDFSYMRPDADSSVGSWTTDSGGTTNLYQQIDEVTTSDADYVKSEKDPTNSIYKVSLADPSGSVDTAQPVRVKYRYQKPTGVSTTSLTVRLVEGTTTRATWVHSNIGDTVVQASQTLSAGEKSAITNWNNLFVEFEADNA